MYAKRGSPKTAAKARSPSCDGSPGCLKDGPYVVALMWLLLGHYMVTTVVVVVVSLYIIMVVLITRGAIVEEPSPLWPLGNVALEKKIPFPTFRSQSQPWAGHVGDS